jgi:hypothetical protein
MRKGYLIVPFNRCIIKSESTGWYAGPAKIKRTIPTRAIYRQTFIVIPVRL